MDPSTGDPMLPKRAAGYSTASAVLMGTDVLSRLTGPELEAVAGYVLAGGTLALVVTRPEDLRHPTLAAFVGGEVTAASVYAATLKELAIPTTGSSAGKQVPRARNPLDTVSPTLSGYSGGNLQAAPSATRPITAWARCICSPSTPPKNLQSRIPGRSRG